MLPDVVRGRSRRKHESNQTPGWVRQTLCYAEDGSRATRVGISAFCGLTATESRSRKSAQDDKWSFCLTAGTLCLRIRRDHEQTTAPEPHTGLQGEGGAF